MAITKQGVGGNQVQGLPPAIDLRDDVISIDEVARRLGIPKTTL